MEIEESLRKVGLTEGEIRVYVSLLGSGETTTGKIVKEARVSSSKVYPILDRLVSMGLVRYIKKAKVMYFRTTSPTRILDMLDKRKRTIEDQKAEISRILPSLLAREKKRDAGHEASVYEGNKAVKGYFKNLVRDAVKGDERLVFGARPGYPVARGAQYFFQSFHRGWVEKGLKTRMIFNEDMRGKKSVEFFKGFPLTEVRFLSQVTMSSIGIQKDCIDILIWTKESVLLFAIRSTKVAKTFKDYFEILWKTAKK